MENDFFNEWENIFSNFWLYFGSCFKNHISRERAQLYMKGLLGSIERKNGWQLAEYVGDKSPYAMQYFLDRCVWDADALKDKLICYAVSLLTTPEDPGVLIVDETGFIKKGKHSAGVGRQYSGAAGRVENSQIGVFLSLATSKGRVLIDRELYLPKDWCNDKERCKRAGIPSEITFLTKPQIAIAMLERAFLNGIKPKWVLADALYGSSREFHRFLEAHNQPYILSIKSNRYVHVDGETKKVSELVNKVSWFKYEVGEGTKGGCPYEWGIYEIKAEEESGFKQVLLFRREIENKEECSYYFCFAELNASKESLAQGAGMRWKIESCFEASKQEIGLNEYEVRTWHGWYRHITMAMLALLYLVELRNKMKEKEDSNKKKQK